MSEFAVKGIRLASCYAGIRKKQRNDLSLIEICEGASVSAVFTQNAFCAAPVIIAKQHLAKRNQEKKSYLLINAGNANAGTGEQGLKLAEQSCESCAEVFSVSKHQVLPFSTGVIGELLPVEAITAGIKQLKEKELSEHAWHDAAQAIMTTDTKEKFFTKTIDIDGKQIRITGMCKGSGMIKPNMATMLAYVATDAKIEQSLLNEMLTSATEASFNCITVDGDTSTNDACVLIATAQSELEINSHNKNHFYQVLLELFIDMAQAIVRDGEGATKFIEIIVEKGKDSQECKEVAFSVAHSPLVKTAFFASDPNWGRILAAVGKANISKLDVNKIDLYLGETSLIEQGNISASYTEEKGQHEMNKTDIQIRIVLNRGEFNTKVWTCDFSYDYVKINADYRS